jgi:hypothetical protein
MDKKETEEVEYILENFKGMLWDELEDDLSNMSKEEMQAIILELKKRFG